MAALKNNAWTDAEARMVVMREEKHLLIQRMNAEMKAIANSPTEEVMQFRLGLLAKFAGELKVLNDRMLWWSVHKKVL